MTPDKLVYMANQIATFFTSQGEGQGEGAAARIADHLAKFWDPRMRQALLAHDAGGGEGLSPSAREAVALLRERSAFTSPGAGRPQVD
jgi:formate dehydrogenase subunit delta